MGIFFFFYVHVYRVAPIRHRSTCTHEHGLRQLYITKRKCTIFFGVAKKENEEEEGETSGGGGGLGGSSWAGILPIPESPASVWMDSQTKEDQGAISVASDIVTVQDTLSLSLSLFCSLCFLSACVRMGVVCAGLWILVTIFMNMPVGCSINILATNW